MQAQGRSHSGPAVAATRAPPSLTTRTVSCVDSHYRPCGSTQPRDCTPDPHSDGPCPSTTLQSLCLAGLRSPVLPLQCTFFPPLFPASAPPHLRAQHASLGVRQCGLSAHAPTSPTQSCTSLCTFRRVGFVGPSCFVGTFQTDSDLGEGAGRARAVAARCAGRDAAPASQDTAGAQ